MYCVYLLYGGRRPARELRGPRVLRESAVENGRVPDAGLVPVARRLRGPRALRRRGGRLPLLSEAARAAQVPPVARQPRDPPHSEWLLVPPVSDLIFLFHILYSVHASKRNLLLMLVF